MILNSIDTQFQLADNGQIAWQRDLTNPMPGEVVAEIAKGESILAPKCALVSADSTKDEDQEAVHTLVSKWLETYVAQALEPLFNLKLDDVPAGAPRNIADKLYDGLGVIERSDVQSFISQMEEEQRVALRNKKIRFGPLLVYLPELNKPAAVKLRGLLLSLWEEKELPAVTPADGIVSFSVEGQDLDKAYYQSMGYPIYGPRSVRVDMLDRVICTVYDSAKDGKFMAEHKMAEWLGSNIADLYAILEAMGHKKIHDPADDIKAEEAKSAEVNEDAVAEAEIVPEAPKAEVTKSETPAVAEEKQEAPKEIVKPVLATFALKKGKAIDTPQTSKPNNKFKSQNFKSDKKTFKKKPKSKPQDQGQRVYKAEAKSNPEDNPFAILQQLKTKE